MSVFESDRLVLVSDNPLTGAWLLTVETNHSFLGEIPIAMSFFSTSVADIDPLPARPARVLFPTFHAGFTGLKLGLFET